MDSILERWTRLLLAIALFGAALGLYYAWKVGTGDARYSIFDLLRGKAVAEALPPETYTTPAGPAVDINEVQLLERLNTEYSNLIKAVVPSVVSINTTKIAPRYTDSPPAGTPQDIEALPDRTGLGSGVIVTPQGHILTNYHLMADAADILVTLHGGRNYKAQLVGSDPRADISVLKINGSVSESFPCLFLGNSDAVNVADMVFAVGNPFGLTETVTRGIISAKERRLTDADTGFFQTDTVINPGSSGGPLINHRGEIIGINVYIYTGRQGLRTWQGVGLAIPSNDVRASFEGIMNQGRPSRGYLGIGVEDIYPDIALRLGLTSSKGAVIREVISDSPAEHAGLKPNDVILTFNGVEVETTTGLIQEVRRQPVGSTVKLGLVRDRIPTEVTAVIGERSTEVSLATKMKAGVPRLPISEILGVTVSDLTADQKQRLGLLPESSAVIVTRVEPGSPASTSLLVDDLIHEINRQPIDSAEEFTRAINGIPINRTSAIFFTRNGARSFVILQPRAGGVPGEGDNGNGGNGGAR